MENQGQYQLVFGDGSNMDILRNDEVDLVLGSPPYFSDDTEALLKQPVSEQTELTQVREEINTFALGLRPVYEEVRRVLKPGGVLALQVKDIHYGGALIALAPLHREMIEATGLNLVSRVYWHRYGRHSPSSRFLKNPSVGAFRSDVMEEILIFSDQEIKTRKKAPVELTREEITKCSSPVWNMAPAGIRRKHPYQSPRTLVKRMIALFTEHGDLVVDPFAGAGTTLAVAVEMGRRGVGYEIEEQYAKQADEDLFNATSKELHP